MEEDKNTLDLHTEVRERTGWQRPLPCSRKDITAPSP